MDYDLREKKFKPNADGRAFYSEREVQCFTRDLIQALDCIHKHRVLHCDIKP